MPENESSPALFLLLLRFKRVTISHILHPFIAVGKLNIATCFGPRTDSIFMSTPSLNLVHLAVEPLETQVLNYYPEKCALIIQI